MRTLLRQVTISPTCNRLSLCIAGKKMEASVRRRPKGGINVANAPHLSSFTLRTTGLSDMTFTKCCVQPYLSSLKACFWTSLIQVPLVCMANGVRGEIFGKGTGTGNYSPSEVSPSEGWGLFCPSPPAQPSNASVSQIFMAHSLD